MFKIGQKICLWQLKFETGVVRVLKEVIVTVAEEKTGTPGEFSRNPTSMQSLKGMGADGKIYEKHWDSWPESQTSEYAHQWSSRGDGEGRGAEKLWAPYEAVHVYNTTVSYKLKLVDKDGLAIMPRGSIVYCKEHNRYQHEGTKCFRCSMAKVMAEK